MDSIEETKRSDGRIEIFMEPDKEIHYCIIRIKDNGTGIREENINRIFDPFFTTKSPDKGTGLGLTISYNIIKSLNGEMWVESSPGDGATFYIKIPVIKNTESI
jgi:signal transduction histidine kinase